MLDEAADTKGARRRSGSRLVVVQAMSGEAQHVALLGQIREESLAFVSHRVDISGHCDPFPCFRLDRSIWPGHHLSGPIVLLK